MKFSSRKLKLRLFQLLSLLVVSALVYFAFRNRDIASFSISKIQSVWTSAFSDRTDVLLFCFVILLMPLNWTVEAFKWKTVVRNIADLSLGFSLKSVFAGLSLGFFFPNRTGEFVGKSLMLPKNDFWKASVLSIYSSFSQMLATILFGFIAALFCTNIWSSVIYFSSSFLFLLVFSLVLAALFFVYLKFDVFTKLLKRFNKVYSQIAVIDFLKLRSRLAVLFLSLARYAIFTTQYVLLFWLFDIDFPFIDLFFLTSILYLLMMFVPTVLLTDLPARSALTLVLFEMLYSSFSLQPPIMLETKLVLISTVIWLLNIVLPALCGAVFIPEFKLFHKK